MFLRSQSLRLPQLQGLRAALSTKVPLPGVTPSLFPRHPISFPKGAGGRRKTPERRTLSPTDTLPFPGRKGGAGEDARPTGRACAIHQRPLEWNRVAGLTAPPRMRLRSPRVLSPLPSLPLQPRGGSGQGGTMFTSTGSSGLCEYRLPPTWLSPTRYPAHLEEEAGGSGGPWGCRRFAGRSSWRPHLLVVPARRGQRAPPPPQPGGRGWRMGTESRRQPRPPPTSLRCDVQVLQELLHIGSAVRVRLGALLVSQPGPLSSAVRVPG